MKFLLLAMTLLTVGNLAAASDDPRLAQSMDIAARFQKELGERLMTAMASGGPVEAIAVCHTDAPDIAAQLSNETGALVGRTALRLRNSANAPDAGARAVLEDFRSRLEAGATEPPERFERGTDGSARYMKAIVMQPQCLACHGQDLAEPVSAAIEERYPEDQATGFVAGELRGAFLIEWPAPNVFRP
jgi:hypothetical protein